MGDLTQKTKMDEKNSTLNDRPLFMQNGNRRFSTTLHPSEEVSQFRKALPQFLAVSVKNILLFAYGTTLGFPTIVIPAIQGGDGREKSDIVLDRDEISWFSSINLICVPLGCVFSGLLTQPIGKRRAMQIVNLPLLASWLMFHFATRTEHLYAALCLSGLGGGLMEAPVLTYVAEITEPKYRGILSALGSTCVISGVFIQFILGSLIDWRTIAAVSAAFPVISIVALCFVPESPVWLIRQQRYREAVKALQWLRGWVPEYYIEEEFNRLYDELIVKPAQEESEENHGVKPSYCVSRMRLFRKRSFLVPFLLVAYTFFTGHFSGKTTLQTYAVQIFHTLKAPINKYHATILLGVAELVATILSVFLIHFTGKRPLVLISTIGVGVCFFGTATYAHYLKVVPGFAVNNVVVNASSIVPKESIISQDNITKIFANEEKALLLAAEKRLTDDFKVDSETTIMFDETTTISNELTTLSDEDDSLLLDDFVKRSKRSNGSSGIYESPSLFNDFNENFTLDYDSIVGGNLDNETFALDLLDSNELEELKMNSTEDNDLVLPQTTLLPNTDDSILTSTAEPKPEDKPSVLTQKEVVEEILLPVPKQKKNNLVWLPLILLLGSAFFAHLGIRMIPWILIGEVFPAPVRSTASGLVSGLGYIFGFLANKLFLQMLTALTLPGTFWFYSFVAFLGALILYYTLPETEGRTLGEIEAHFSKKSETNLLSKKWRKNDAACKTISNNNNESNNIDTSLSDKRALPLCNVNDLQSSNNPESEYKVIQLKQSHFIKAAPNDHRQNIGGHDNLAFDEQNNTTHL